MALAIGAGLVWLRVHTALALALERFYFGEYGTSEVFGDFSGPSLSKKPRDPRKPFAVVFVGKYLANEARLDQPNGPVTVQILMLEPKAFHKWIKDAIYFGRSLQGWLLWQVVGAEMLALMLVGGGACLDREHDREVRNGRHMRVTPKARLLYQKPLPHRWDPGPVRQGTKAKEIAAPWQESFDLGMFGSVRG